MLMIKTTFYLCTEKKRSTETAAQCSYKEKKRAKGKEIGGGTDEAEDSLNVM